MSSKIKVDTIENVAGSGNVSLGSGHNLVVPGDLTVDTSTLKVDSSNNRVGVGTTSPDGALHVKGMSDHGRIIVESGGNTGANNNTFIQFHNNGGTEVSQITVEETATNEGQMVFKTGGTTTAMTIDKDGHITQPLQSAFLARKNSDTTNLAVNTAHTIVFNTEVFDQNADYDNSTGIFTAPVTGRYQINVMAYLHEVPNDANYVLIELVASNRSVQDIFRTQAGDTDWTYQSFQINILLDMDAGDTAKVNFYQPNGSQQVDIQGHGTHAHTSFSGYLVC